MEREVLLGGQGHILHPALREDFEIGRVLHLKSEIGKLKSDWAFL
jgi:hypothetical protein